ncbi:CvpA family protein [Candidatus Margulisiibacteriota bacterium]
MNWVDTVITAMLGLNIFNGLKRGFILSLFDILAVVLAVVFSLKWFHIGIDLLTDTFHFSEPLAYVISFAMTWVAIYCVISLLGAIVHKFLTFSFLLPIDVVAGGVLGFVKGIIFSAIIFVPLTFLPFLPENIDTALQDSLIMEWAKPSIVKRLPGLSLNIKDLKKSLPFKTEDYLQ